MKGHTWLGLFCGITLLILLSSPGEDLRPHRAKTALPLVNLNGPAICRSAPIKVMPLGDSITHGSAIAGGYRIPLWHNLLAEGWAVDFVGSQANGPFSIDRDHEGHPGQSIQYLREHVIDWLDRYRPDLILLMIGTNDVLYPQRQDFAQAAYRLRALIDQVTRRLPETELLVASIPTLADPAADERAEAINSEIADMVATYARQGVRVHYVEIFRLLSGADLADGVHPNAEGYEKIAAAWYRAMDTVMAQRC